MLRDELSDIIASGDIKANVYPEERLLRGVTVVDIDFASDLSTAKVSLSILGNSVEKRQVYVWLCNNIGQVRYELSQRLRDLRRVPEIRFVLVDTQSAQYLNKVLDEIAEANGSSGGTGAGAAGVQEGLVDFEEADDAD
jgi:ribosome-binding factor A